MKRFRSNADVKRDEGLLKREYSVYKFSDYEKGRDTIGYPVWYYAGLKRMKGYCKNCGSDLPKGKRSYCSGGCQFDSRCAVHDMRVTSLRRFIHKKFNFECCKCGCRLCKVTQAGVQLPIFIGSVDHIIPLFKGGEDKIHNLQLLCYNCHKEKTKQERINPTP